METSINLTNYYWDLEHRKDEAATDLTEEMLDKHAGKWIDDRSTEEIISNIRDSRSAIREPLNFD